MKRQRGGDWQRLKTPLIDRARAEWFSLGKRRVGGKVKSINCKEVYDEEETSDQKAVY